MSDNKKVNKVNSKLSTEKTNISEEIFSEKKTTSKKSQTKNNFLSADFAKQILIFTDGACSGNPGPGGWGSIISYPEGRVKELGGHKSQTTNNEMELMAAIQALEEIQNDLRPVLFYTDSTYVIRGITQWIWGWLRNDWKTAEGKEVANKGCWQKLSSWVQRRGNSGKIQWLYSRGHVGTPGNERCDEIAVSFSQKKWVDLYEGPLLNYSISIYDVPEDGSLPAPRTPVEKKAAYSYLSLIGSEVCRHSTWTSCERRVKGQSGAKFKKATSQDDEFQILKTWGLSPHHLVKDVP